jgi:deoxyribodipyrimidine photo-lyase
VTTAVVLFTRDLRVHDNPALREAYERAQHVVPLFVLDDALLAASPRAANRLAFLLESLHDLRGSLERLGAPLVVRRGDVVAETLEVVRATRAKLLLVAEDVSAYARRRERRLEAACAAQGVEPARTASVTVVPPGDLTPAGRTHYSVFTPFWRRWQATPLRAVLPPPGRLTLPPRVAAGRIPALRELTASVPSPGRAHGGETSGRARLEHFLADGLARYDQLRDDLAADGTTRLSAHLHFGCVSPLELTARARALPDGLELVRQLCWRDFFAQLVSAVPRVAREDLNPARRAWVDDAEALDAWRQGRTGYPLVDAGMRQLREEGFVHNRARLVVASFLTRTLGLDWRHGAAHFAELLTDADVASNAGNWQWSAGTGTDTRPNRVLSPVRQAHRFDPSGAYVRRYVPELAPVEGAALREPWLLASPPTGYPARIVP